MALLTNILDTLAIQSGLGRHSYSLTPSNRLDAVFWIWTSFTSSYVWNGMSKIALICAILRITVKWWHIWLLYAIICQLVLLETAQTVVNYVQCHPTQRLWDPTHGGGCWDPQIQENLALAIGAYVAAMSLILALFPVVSICSLEVSKQAKVGSGATMFFGLIAAGSSVVKTITYQNLSERLDFTWESQSSVIWIVTENCATMIAACMPTLFPLIQEMALGDVESIKANHHHLRRPVLPPIAFSSRLSLRYDSSHTVNSQSVSTTRSQLSLTFERPRKPPPVPRPYNTARTIQKQKIGLRSSTQEPLRRPPTPLEPEVNAGPRYPSPGYISREDQVYLGATSF